MTCSCNIDVKMLPLIIVFLLFIHLNVIINQMVDTPGQPSCMLVSALSWFSHFDI